MKRETCMEYGTSTKFQMKFGIGPVMDACNHVELCRSMPPLLQNPSYAPDMYR